MNAALACSYCLRLRASWKRVCEDRQSEGAGALDLRLKNARTELARARDFDYLVVNTDLDRAIADVEGMIRAERRRPRRTPDLLAEFERGIGP